MIADSAQDQGTSLHVSESGPDACTPHHASNTTNLLTLPASSDGRDGCTPVFRQMGATYLGADRGPVKGPQILSLAGAYGASIQGSDRWPMVGSIENRQWHQHRWPSADAWLEDGSWVPPRDPFGCRTGPIRITSRIFPRTTVNRHSPRRRFSLGSP